MSCSRGPRMNIPTFFGRKFKQFAKQGTSVERRLRSRMRSDFVISFHNISTNQMYMEYHIYLPA